MTTTIDQDRGLDATLAGLERLFGTAVVVSPNGEASTPPAVIATGSRALDGALGIGGLPRGRITEVYGPEGTGKTTLALSVLAQTQRAGGVAVFIDAEHALDLAWAATVGVDVHALLLCQPDSGEQALEVACRLADSGAVDAIALDSVAALVPRVELAGPIGRYQPGAQGVMLSAALRQLIVPVARNRVALVATNQLRQRAGVAGAPTYTAGGRALGYSASVRLSLDHPTVTSRGRKVRAQVAKNKLGPAGQEVTLEFHQDHGLRP
jgi:recombination protein RecA